MATNSNNNNTISSTVSKKATTQLLLLSEANKLTYEIHDCSGFSENFFPENILTDCPSDHNSRWSVQTNKPPQYLILKLKRPAVVRAVKFGKYEKRSVCNIKKFRIYGGLDEHHMDLLLEGGLNDDPLPEVFRLRCATTNFRPLPILFLKIEPLLSWGGSFNCSIWYLEMHGQDEDLPMTGHPAVEQYNARRQEEIVRLCLKHFRQQGYQAAFQALQQQTQVRLEHPLVGDLYKALVIDGDYEGGEELLLACVEKGFADAFLQRQEYKHSWSRQQQQHQPQASIYDANENASVLADHTADSLIDEQAPSNRGGHQLVIDTDKAQIYLYGGWDGYQDLSDLWLYQIESGRWSLLCQNSEMCNGPTPRSCHKMVYDPLSENIFMLGRFLDNSIRTIEYIKSDFFLYDTRARTWLQICDDTSHVGGPQLVYDHQMCIDTEKRRIYVFGGKILTPRSVYTATTTSEPEYSGLFSYHIPTNTWTQILVDCNEPTKLDDPLAKGIRSRVTHCMVFHTKHRKLYIYGGQRGKEDIDEFITFDVDDEQVRPVVDEAQKRYICGSAVGGGQGNGKAGRLRVGGPSSEMKPTPGYTLRATIDCERDEIYVFSSLNKVKDRRDSQLDDASNSVWVYSLSTHAWRRVYHLKAPTFASSGLPQQTLPPHHLQKEQIWNVLEPCPRYAHQFIYDDVAKLHYLFGGNPGRANMSTVRLDDLWILRLEKPKRDDVMKQCRYLIRTLCYEEMARFDPFKAMQYLRTHIAAVIDHQDPEQLSNFHKLASLLFHTEDTSATVSSEEEETPLPDSAALDDQQSLSPLNDYEVDQPEQQVTRAISPPPATNRLQRYSEIMSEATDDLSMDTMSTSTATSSTTMSTTVTTNSVGGASHISESDAASYQLYCKSGGKRAIRDYLAELKGRRECLFDKLVRFMPADVVQPLENLTDFVTAV